MTFVKPQMKQQNTIVAKATESRGLRFIAQGCSTNGYRPALARPWRAAKKKLRALPWQSPRYLGIAGRAGVGWPGILGHYRYPAGRMRARTISSGRVILNPLGPKLIERPWIGCTDAPQRQRNRRQDECLEGVRSRVLDGRFRYRVLVAYLP